MNDTIKTKLEKLYTLAQRGATPGEQQAAKAALDRLMKKYNLSDDALLAIELRDYEFTFNSKRAYELLIRIIKHFEPQVLERPKFRVHDGWRTRNILRFQMKHIEWVTIDCAYEYYRRHMDKQWKAHCAPHVKRCRTTKGKNKRREQLLPHFMTEYLIRSGLIPQNQITNVELSEKEAQARAKVRGVEGGSFNRQMTNGFMLE